MSSNNCKRSRSRSATGRRGKDSKASSLPPDAPSECKHVPPPPCRPPGPFALYFAANMASVGAKQANSAMEKLAVKWGCMSEEEKAPYYQKAEEVKAAYFSRKAEFFAKRKDLGLKYPISGYAMFIADFASKNHGKYPCATDIIREGAQEWKRLPLEEKDKWNKQSLDYSESYAEKMWSVCKKKVAKRDGKYDSRVRTIKPVDYKPPGHEDVASDEDVPPGDGQEE